MIKLNIGDMVQMDGECECSPKSISGEPIWYDVKDCYHKPNAVKRVFRDGRSAWVANRYGYARRIHDRDLYHTTRPARPVNDECVNGYS